jgi:hypothetical protein
MEIKAGQGFLGIGTSWLPLMPQVACHLSGRDGKFLDCAGNRVAVLKSSGQKDKALIVCNPEEPGWKRTDR